MSLLPLKPSQLGQSSGDNSPVTNILVQKGGTLYQGETTADADRRQNEIIESQNEIMEVLRKMREDQAKSRGLDPALLIPIFEKLQQVFPSVDAIAAIAPQAIRDLIALSNQTVPIGLNDDTRATISEARTKLGKADTLGARAVLAAKLESIKEAQRQQEIQQVLPLLRETADIERLSYDYDSAEATIQKLLALSQELADADPTVVNRQLDFLNAQERAANLIMQKTEWGLALNAYEAMLDSGQRLLKANPENSDVEGLLAAVYEGMGDLRVKIHGWMAAIDYYMPALEIRQRRVQQDPDNLQWTCELAVTCAVLGRAIIDTRMGLPAPNLNPSELARNADKLFAELRRAHPKELTDLLANLLNQLPQPKIIFYDPNVMSEDQAREFPFFRLRAEPRWEVLRGLLRLPTSRYYEADALKLAKILPGINAAIL